MSGEQLTRLTSALEQGSVILGQLFARLAQPARARRLRWGIIALASVWLVLAGTRLIWAFLPQAEMALPADIVILNPVESAGGHRAIESIDIDTMLSWHLLGEVDAASAELSESFPEVEQATGREGIEEDAQETRLELRLRGIIASTADGLGRAIIEHKSKQQVYAVDDKLPISGRVMLAKVMRDRVVIDNRGTYELLILFEDSTLSSQLPDTFTAGSSPPIAATAVRAIDKRGDSKATALAQSYRQRLYQNPQSLAKLVRITAVRDEGILLGYRVSPGSDSAQFEQLGFKAGDLVTSVNGIALNDPGNTVRLYQLMRSAREAVFDLEREGQLLSVSVSLDDTGDDQ